MEGFYGVEGGEEAMEEKEREFPAKNKDTKSDSFDLNGFPTTTRE